MRWTLASAQKMLAQIEARDKATDLTKSFHLGRVGFRKQTKRYLKSIDKGIEDAILKGKLQTFIDAQLAKRNGSTPKPKASRVKEVRKRWSDLPLDQRYDLGFGHLGNGLTVWNSAREVQGDYEGIAHISEDGLTISWRKNRLPQHVIDCIKENAEQVRANYLERKQYQADCALSEKHWYLSQGYIKKQIVNRYGDFDETDIAGLEKARERIESYTKKYPNQR